MDVTQGAPIVRQVTDEGRPVTDAEAAALASLLPQDDSDGYGVAWALVPVDESAPG